jgi:hypothetical protein
MTGHDNGRRTPVALDALEEHADAVARELDDEVDRLRGVHAREDEVQEMLRELVDASKTRQTRIRRALGALTGESSTPGRAPSAPAPTPTPSGRSDRARARPASENLELVLEELVAAGKPQSNQQMIDRLQGRISHDTVRRALVALRDDERVRVAGQTPQGGVIYAPMPGASGAA